MSKSKREQVRERQRREKIRSYVTWGAVGLAVVLIVAFFVLQGAGPVAAIGEEIEIPANYIDHIEEGADPGPFPSNPPAGGRHYASQYEAGFYDEDSPEAQASFPAGYIGHSLEHGYVVFWYNCDVLIESKCSTLKSEIQTVMDEFNGVKLIAFPWPSLDAPVAMTSWGRLQRFETFDPQLAAAFIEANRNKAPEPNAQ